MSRITIKDDSIKRSIYSKVAIKHGISTYQVKEVYGLVFKFIKETSAKIDAHTAPEDEIDAFKGNFYLPSFSKFYLNKQHVKKARAMIQKYKQAKLDKQNEQESK